MKNFFKIGFIFVMFTIAVGYAIPGYSLAQIDPNFCQNNPGSPYCSGGTTSRGDITITGAPVIDCPSGTVQGFICNIQNLLNTIVPVLIGLGVVYFVWGVVQYMIGGGEEAKKKGRDHVVFGIIGLAVIVGLWGIVNLTVNTFLDKPQTIIVPALVPTTTSAQGSDCELGSNPKIQNFLKYATCSIQNSVIPLMFALAIVFFVWGVIQYVILGAGEETKRTQGRQHMIWGVIALAVMLGVWGLVGIVTRTFGPDIRVLPQVKP